MKRLENVLFFLTLLFLPTQLGRHFWPSFAYIYSLRIDYLSPTIYLWDILVLALTLVFVLRGKKINRTGLNLILVFLLSQLISLIPQISTAAVLGTGLTRLEEYFFACLFGLYIASTSLTFLNGFIFLPLLISVLGESFLSLVQFFKGSTAGLWIFGERTFDLTTPGIAKFDFYGREFLRPYATFSHPNVLAAFMIIEGIIIAWITKGKTNTQRILGKITFASIAITTMLTVSRVAILAGFSEAFLLLGKTWRILLIILVFLLSPILFTRYSSILSFDNLSLVRREELSQAALQLWAASPVFGIGLNNFIPKASEELLAGPSRFLQPVHNIFLLTLSETGLLGLLGFLVLLGYPIFMLFRLRPKPLHLILGWAAIVFLGSFDHYFLTLPQGYRLLFFFWGLSLSMLEFKGEENPEAIGADDLANTR